MIDVCEVWWADLTQLRAEHSELLDPSELARRERLRRPADRDRLTLGAALVRLAVGTWLHRPAAEIRIDRHCPSCDQPHGRPRLADFPELFVSVSHSGGRVAVALTGAGEVGVDVEQVSQVDIVGLSRNVLGEGEAATGPADFFTYWTRKEAVLKATGDGLNVAMPKVRVSPPASPPRLLSFDGRPDLQLQLHDLDPGPGYHAALAILSSSAVLPRPLHVDLG